MWAIRRTTYAWLTASLLVLSLLLIFGSILALHLDRIQNADFLVRFVVFPGGLIAGGIVFLINGCLEYYADLLPGKYRGRTGSRSQWESIYNTEQMHALESILIRFARSHGFRATDAFQFAPGDRLEELMREFYPDRSDLEERLRRSDLTGDVADTPMGRCLRDYVAARMGPDGGRATRQANTAGAEQKAGSGRIDRHARNRLAHAIRRYEDELLSAFAFDEEIFEIRKATADKTVQYVVDTLWLHYDDCKDHLAGLSKPEWDYFERLILLLESDAEIERFRQRHWSLRQLVAGLSLIGFGLCVTRLGIGWHLFGFALLFGPISLFLSYWRIYSDRRQAGERLRLMPFSSFSELRAVRRTVAGFSKRRRKADAKVRQVHGRLLTTVVWIQTAVLWSFISPLILAFQALPEKEVSTRIHRGAAPTG